LRHESPVTQRKAALAGISAGGCGRCYSVPRRATAPGWLQGTGIAMTGRRRRAWPPGRTWRTACSRTTTTSDSTPWLVWLTASRLGPNVTGPQDIKPKLWPGNAAATGADEPITLILVEDPRDVMARPTISPATGLRLAA
jgi:hypothetical protein